jgi:hypothetical protein
MSIKNRARDRQPDSRLKRRRRVSARLVTCAKWHSKSPRWFRNLRMTRPERREVQRVLCLVRRGVDPDGLVFPLNHKPARYWY